jgi:hypothetical protein
MDTTTTGSLTRCGVSSSSACVLNIVFCSDTKLDSEGRTWLDAMSVNSWQTLQTFTHGVVLSSHWHVDSRRRAPSSEGTRYPVLLCCLCCAASLCRASTPHHCRREWRDADEKASGTRSRNVGCSTSLKDQAFVANTKAQRSSTDNVGITLNDNVGCPTAFGASSSCLVCKCKAVLPGV